MRVVGGGLAAASLLLAGCGVLQGDVPEWITNRQPLPQCADGPIDANGPDADAAQVCMLDAHRAGRGAELVTAGEMATGDPMVSYVRVHENGTIEMFLNLGADPSAPGAWERFRCEDLVPSGGVRGPDESLFSLGGCEQLPVP